MDDLQKLPSPIDKASRRYCYRYCAVTAQPVIWSDFILFLSLYSTVDCAL